MNKDSDSKKLKHRIAEAVLQVSHLKIILDEGSTNKNASHQSIVEDVV